MSKTLRIKVIDGERYVHFNRVYTFDFSSMDHVRNYADLCMSLRDEYPDCFIDITEEI